MDQISISVPWQGESNTQNVGLRKCLEGVVADMLSRIIVMRWTFFINYLKLGFHKKLTKLIVQMFVQINKKILLYWLKILKKSE